MGGALKVLISSTSFGRILKEPRDFLEGRGYELIGNDLGRPLKVAELIEQLKGIDGCIAGLDEFTAEALESAEDLKVISRHGAGVDNIDLKAATRKGIVVTNTPFVNSEAVADLAFGLMLAAARRIPCADSETKAGRWPKILGRAVYGKTLGIVGLGRIGRGVARRARGFDMEVLAFDIAHDTQFADEYGVKYVTLDELLEESDFITLHLPLSQATRGIIGRRELEMMKQTAFLINTARGALVDEGALYDTLKSGKIAGAAIDVYGEEPPVNSLLLNLDNIVTTPHIGSYTHESLLEMGMIAAQNLVDVLEGKRPLNTVNPEVYDGLRHRA